MLREEQTTAEKVLWDKLRDRRFLDLKFRRQFPIEGFIADFYCHDERLIVEIDGSVHNEPEQMLRDENRDAALRKLSIKLLRVSNHEVFEDIDAVLRQIAHSTKVAYRLDW
jgi:very-short-patch-repair endonuclease